ncbi:response regulator [Calidithermus roseus]|uniref:histidine kinase n=1 Tax=Calidithermus roseus TaxID=1644118 RepID=A0A399EXB2_9DEIN|nr:response regulator [Calidithermus roseus]RIH86931.1 Chemotaxis protein CheA [Calidithermus roseus]
MPSPIPELLQSFLAEAWEAVLALEQIPDYVARQEFEPLVIVTHRLKGSAGLYNFPQLSRLAGLLERLLEGAPRLTPQQQEQLTRFVGLASACICDALDSIAQNGHEGGVGLNLSRLGASSLLGELAFANPQAWVAHPPSDPGAELGEGDAPEEDAPYSASLREELHRFFRENPDIWEFFAPEVLEHLDTAQNALEHLAGEGEEGDVTALFRALHTIKGAAYSVGCTPIGKLAHKLEDLLVLVRDGQRPWSGELASIVAEGVGTIQLMLTTAEGRSTDLEAHIIRLEGLLGEPTGLIAEAVAPAPAPQPAEPQATPVAPSPETRSTVRVALERLDHLLDLTGEVIGTRSRFESLLSRLKEIDEALENSRLRLMQAASDFESRYLNPTLSESKAPAAEETGEAGSSGIGKSVQEMFSELEFDRYTDLNILARSVSEMVADLNEVRSQLGATLLALRDEQDAFGKITRSLRSEVGRIRLVPIGRLYQRLRRQVRQIAADRPIRLELSGEQVELDSLVLDGLVEPLVHIVNNAIVHGIESPEIRLQRGKPAEGLLRIRTYQRGGDAFIEVQDDGNGIDVEAVRAKAIEKGLRNEADLQNLSRRELIELIFLPGLSTAPTITQEAGRGVGMDAVWNSVRRLKGDITIETQEGLGTTFRLRVPQSLIVSDVLILEASGHTLGLPSDTVRALRLVEGSAQTLEHEGERYPIQKLSRLLRLPESELSEMAVVYLEVAGRQLALGVDRLVGLQQSIVKPFEEPLSLLGHFSGALVAGTGEVILVLDPSGLLRLQADPYDHRAISSLNIAAPAQQTILLADDSLSVRKMVGQNLRRLGYNVVTAADGQEALEILQEGTFAALITDLEMPRMSGFELLEEVRRRPHLAHLPVAILTTRASAKHRDLAMQLGVNAYLTKPADEAQLLQFLREGVRT